MRLKFFLPHSICHLPLARAKSGHTLCCKCIVFTLAALLLFPSLTACSLLPGPEPEPVTLTFAFVSYPWLAGRSADYERLAEAFHKTHSRINVLVKPLDWRELPQNVDGADFLTDPQQGVDVIALDAAQISALAGQGLVHELGAALAGEPGLESKDFYAPALDALRWQGGLYGLPSELDLRVMFYNRDRFDAAGLSYPTGDWRWDDFLASARALKEPGRFAFGSWGAQVTPWVYQNGGQLVDDLVTPTRATLDDPATVQAVRWYVDLALLEGVMPTPTDLAEYALERGRQTTILTAGDAANKATSQAQADLEQATESGDVALWTGWLSRQGSYWGRWDFGWGVVPLPAGRQAATVARVQGYAVTAHSQNLEQALQWVNYLTRQPPLHGGLPARRSVAREHAFRGQLRPEIQESLDACLTALEQGTVLPATLETQAAAWLQGPLFAVLAGELTLEEALDIVQQQAQEGLGQE